jgi:hypothetical protein
MQMFLKGLNKLFAMFIALPYTGYFSQLVIAFVHSMPPEPQDKILDAQAVETLREA